MKIHGKKIQGANIEWIIIPRHDGDLVFKATAVLDMKPFYALCPEPKAPVVMRPGRVISQDITDKNYLESVDRYANYRYYFIIVWSLKDSPGLEFEKVDLNNPDSWLLIEEELKESGLTYPEIQRLLAGCMSANSLNENKLEEARNRFLAFQAAQSNGSSSHPGEPQSTPSGEPAKDSEPAHQA